MVVARSILPRSLFHRRGPSPEISPEIFRAYDIRGVVGDQLSDEVAYLLGRAIGTAVRHEGGRRTIVGRDHRPSGVHLGRELARGLSACGCDVVDIGVSPTPVGYWAIQRNDADAGVQVTGSHNPADYNGFKVSLGGGAIHGDAIAALRRRIEHRDFVDGAGSIRRKAVMEAYIADLAGRLRRSDRRLEVVVDAGNGTAGLTAVPLYERLGYAVRPLHCELDGTFPNHHPDPTVEANLDDLRRELAARGADVGLAFDGDADRIGVVDRDGTIIPGDELLIILARELLTELPGATIIGEVKCSQRLFDDVRRHGGVPVMGRTGHSLIKALMRELSAPLAGEMSGHVFFGHRYYGFDDAVYAGGRLLEILSRTGQSLGEMLADLPRTKATPEIRVECPDARKFELVDRVRERFAAAASGEGFRVVDLDGVRVEWSDGWGLVRASNTQPSLVMRFEASSRERLQEIEERFERELAAARAG
jgi:phosphomannomutase/phosphoglucomutase